METSFSRCVCLVFDYCQFDCSLHINCLILSQMKLIITHWLQLTCLLSDEILNFLPSLKALHGFLFKCFSLFLLHYDFSLLDIEVFCLGIKSPSLVISINLCEMLFSDWHVHNCSRIIALVVEAIKKNVYSARKNIEYFSGYLRQL